MVVSTSNSNTTLVSLQNGDRHHRRKEDLIQSSSPLSVLVSSVPPLLEAACGIASLDESETAIQLPESSTIRLKIPKNFTSTSFLQRYEVLAEQREVLFAQDVVIFDDDATTTQELYVYVAQGEVATTCTTQSCDVLLSDRATTCHILALWSSNCRNIRRTEPCCTLMHIDGTGYDESLRAAFVRHDTYHQHSSDTVFHLHMIGGFDEEKSLEISASLLTCLADLSQTYRIVLDTCVISTLNQNEIHGGPQLRGLALDCKTGRVYPAHSNAHMILGPVRSLRLWSRGDYSTTKELLQLFPDLHNDIMVIPKCTWGKVSSRWNKLSDEELLASCSTSPEYEDAEDFCHHLRSTFAFCNQVTPEQVFGMRSALTFRRLGRTNRWVPSSAKEPLH